MESKTLKNLIKLSSKVGIYIPSTVDVNVAIDTATVVDNTLRLLSNSFGGATSTEAIGCWSSVSNGLVKEHITVCYSYTDSLKLEQEIDNIIEYCLRLKQELRQEAISLEVNNELYFI